MALQIQERHAADILARVRALDPDIALNSWARTILGAHGEQAKRLVQYAEALAAGDMMPDEIPLEDGEDITVTRNVEGRDLEITLKSGKLPITSYEDLVEFYEIDTHRWHPTKQNFSFWGSEASPNFSVRAEFRENEYVGLTEADRAATRELYASIAPPTPPEAPVIKDDHLDLLLEIVIADLHADKLTRYGGTVLENLHEVRQGVLSILEKAKMFGFGRIALVFPGDTFDHDGQYMTSNGTPQESVGQSRDSYKLIRDFVYEMTRHCAAVAPTHLYILAGNHDKERAFHAADSLWGLFRNDSLVDVNLSVDRAYIDWGVNLIGLAHGDRVKAVDLAMTLMRENDTYGKQVFEFHLGHEHTRKEEEHHGVLIRRFRSPTPDNQWAHENLYSHNLKSITGILWHRDQGEYATIPHTFLR